ncbi:MAG TPA: hypothetical protein PKY82_23370 [Pyrinomonadaceae bacterium]|nr:hypothetical protein [Pyrinomonadaceae bacterium]
MSEQQMNQPIWTPPPPPEENSMFSDSTRQFYAEEIRKNANKALTFGILSIFCCPPIFAYIAYTSAQEALVNIDIYETGHNHRGKAQAGKILAIIGIVLFAVGIILRILAAAAR